MKGVYILCSGAARVWIIPVPNLLVCIDYILQRVKCVEWLVWWRCALHSLLRSFSNHESLGAVDLLRHLLRWYAIPWIMLFRCRLIKPLVSLLLPSVLHDFCLIVLVITQVKHFHLGEVLILLSLGQLLLHFCDLIRDLFHLHILGTLFFFHLKLLLL